MSENLSNEIVLNWKEHEAFCRNSFDRNLSAVYIANSDGTIRTCNDRFADTFGYSLPGDLIGTNLESYFHDSKAFMDFLRLIKMDKWISNYEADMYGRDGAIEVIYQNVIGVFDEKGDLIEIRGFLVNKADPLIIDDNLILDQKQLFLSKLARWIAHDFNNLLMSIQGNVSIIMMDVDKEHPFYEYLAGIEKEIFEGARLTSHVLTYADNRTHEMKQLNLNILIKETADFFRKLRKEIVINTDLEVNLCNIRGNRANLAQALLHTFEYAADSMKSGGSLKLETRAVSHEVLAGTHYKPKPGNYVRIEMTDNGLVFDVEELNSMFNPIHSTNVHIDRESVLKLSAAFTIIKSHNGYMEIETHNNRRTSLHIYLPIKIENANAVSKEVQKTISKKNGALNILLVDDDKAVLEIGEQVLKKLNYRVFSAKDGIEAISTLKREGKGIDMVILDMIIPGTNSKSTYDQLKEISPKVKVLLSSGYDMNEQAQAMMARGCDGFIQKPFRVKEIERKITEIMSLN